MIQAKPKLPAPFENSKKDVYNEIKDRLSSEDLEGDFKKLTDYDSIENELFGEMMDHQYFVMRLYIKHNSLQTAKEKFMGLFANLATEVGTSHLGIQIGSKIVHWLNCNFCLIKGFSGKGATALFYPQDKDHKEVRAMENTEENRKKICTVIQSWNCTKYYGSFSNNCQAFAASMFKEFGFEESFSKYDGPVGEFIKYISDYKNSKKEIFPCIVKDNKIINEWEWRSHKDLDFWQNSQDPEKIREYDVLLKGFHRAFQIRVVKSEYFEDEEDSNKGFLCPYEDPTLFLDENKNKTNLEELKERNTDSFNANSLQRNHSHLQRPKRGFSLKEPKTNNIMKDEDNFYKKTGPNPSNVKNCKNCCKAFSLLFNLGKNQCGCCKEIFCKSCMANKKVKIPTAFEVEINSFGSLVNGPVNVCDGCFSKIYIFNQK